MSIQYRTEEIESFEGVIEKLYEEYYASLFKKNEVGKELLRTVKEKTKELQQCHEEWEEKRVEIQSLLDEKIVANQAIRDQAENDLRVHKEILEETIRTIEERRSQLEYWQEYVDEGQNRLESEIKALTENIEREHREFQNGKDLINKLWEHYRLLYVKNESENLNRLKRKYLDAGIDSLSQKQSHVIEEKFRLILEIKQQISKIEEQKNEFRQQENTAEMYRTRLNKLRRKFYNIIPIPDLTYRTKSADSEVEYIAHEEQDLCQNETPFRVPLTVQTMWLNYKIPGEEKKKSLREGSSMIVNGEEFSNGAASGWTFNKSRVIRAAHGDYPGRSLVPNGKIPKFIPGLFFVHTGSKVYNDRRNVRRGGKSVGYFVTDMR